MSFKLFANTAYSVHIEATTGAQITYNIDEILSQQQLEYYEGTVVTVNDTTVSVNENPSTTGVQELEEIAHVVFVNKYEDKEEDPDIPWYPPYIPEDDEPEEVEPEPTPEDPKEPPVEPGTEIPNDPEELPEDMVPTGDTNHPAPYFMMMVIGFLGMLFTRRRVK